MKPVSLLVAVSALVATPVHAQQARTADPSFPTVSVFETFAESGGSSSTSESSVFAPGLRRALQTLFDRGTDAPRPAIAWLTPAPGATLPAWLSPGHEPVRREVVEVTTKTARAETVRGSGLKYFGFDVVWTVEALGPASLLHRPQGALGSWPRQTTRYAWSGPRAHANVDWVGLVTEQIRIDTIMHMKRLTETKTRRALYADIDHPVDGYLDALRGYLSGPLHWGDGDAFVTNNINHPLMGAAYTHIFTNHDARCQQAGYGDRGYWSCIKRAGIYAAVASVNWEWNPLMSETAIGHVGRSRRCADGSCAGEGGWSDFVMTPLGGIGFRILGDIAMARLWPFLDRHLSDNRFERFLKNVLKLGTAPGHSFNCALNLDLRGALRAPGK